MEIKRGDVFLVDLSPVVGTEQSGIRPALIIQIDRANEKSPHTIIIPRLSRIFETESVPVSSNLMRDAVEKKESIPF